LIDANGRMMNLPVLVSSGVDAGTIICGDFRELAILSRALELVTNPGNKTGITEVTAFHYVDSYIRHAAAFAVATGTT